jgi:hypothetical protein
MSMSPPSTSIPAAAPAIRGRIIDAEVKVSVDAARPLPLACGLYAIQNPTGVWLCAYYGMNRSVFDYLPQNGAEVDEVTLGIAFQVRQFVPTDQYNPTVWEEFKKTHFMGFEKV